MCMCVFVGGGGGGGGGGALKVCKTGNSAVVGNFVIIKAYSLFPSEPDRFELLM